LLNASALDEAMIVLSRSKNAATARSGPDSGAREGALLGSATSSG